MSLKVSCLVHMESTTLFQTLRILQFQEFQQLRPITVLSTLGVVTTSGKLISLTSETIQSLTSRGNSLNGATTSADMCLRTGVANTTIIDNTLKGCGVGVFFDRTRYSYYHNQAQWGADGAIVHGNEFIDTEAQDIWFYFSYADGVEISENTFSGSTSPEYNIYAQSTYTTDVTISDNVFKNGLGANLPKGAQVGLSQITQSMVMEMLHTQVSMSEMDLVQSTETRSSMQMVEF